MKHVLFIAVICLSTIIFSNCTNDKSEIINIEDDVISDTSQLENLNGIWGLTNYFDSIIHQKSIAKYRIQPTTWFTFLIEINKDSIIHYGSINDGIVKRCDSDTLAKISSMGGNWILVKKGSNLELINVSQKHIPIDTNTYVFRKRDDLKFLTKNINPNHLFMKLDSNITDYFNKELLTGEYILDSRKVNFHPNGQISGLQDYSNYQIRNCFGTLHPFRGADVVFLSSEGQVDSWKWEFKGNDLVLTKLEPDWEESDQYWSTGEQIILTRK